MRLHPACDAPCRADEDFTALSFNGRMQPCLEISSTPPPISLLHSSLAGRLEVHQAQESSVLPRDYCSPRAIRLIRALLSTIRFQTSSAGFSVPKLQPQQLSDGVSLLLPNTPSQRLDAFSECYCGTPYYFYASPTTPTPQLSPI